ncbi:MAG: glycerol-3-phosphate acyltransferase [Proteobacteria bacterium]|nr:glycerol-3-phosphate acyltransferase [Pseudomonadota bacterium]
MTGYITIPIWLFLLFVLLTAWLISNRMLFPSLRWFFRRRINRIIDEIASHLDVEIKPFQLTKRQVLIDRLAYDPKVVKAIQSIAEERHKPREILQAEVMTYAREIVPSFNALLYFRLGYWLAKKIARWLYKVRVDLVEDEKYKDLDPNSTVVFVMNHRSNMDYILVAFLAMERTTLSYAVGEWARIWPLQTLIRAMGAFFVRRKSGNPLYRLVLERYIHMATLEGVCQAVFIEGGLSRDGRLRPPKFGLIDYMLRSFDPEAERDVVFIPVGLNYDRTIEDRSLLRRLGSKVEKRSLFFVLKTTVGFIVRNLAQMVVGKWRRFGYACVNFGTPVSTREYCRKYDIKFEELEREERFEKIEEFCSGLLSEIEKIVPILPVGLIAMVMLQGENQGRTSFEVKTGVDRLIEKLKAEGAHIYYPKHNFEKYIDTALEMLKIRHLVIEDGGLLRPNPEMLDILSYYSNAIVHWLETDGGKTS